MFLTHLGPSVVRASTQVLVARGTGGRRDPFAGAFLGKQTVMAETGTTSGAAPRG